MDYNEANRDKWRQLYKRDQMMGLDEQNAEEDFSEALDILESIESRQSSGDVVNWQERAEMAAAAQRHPGLIQSDEGQSTQDAPQINEEGEQTQEQTGYGYETESQNQPTSGASSEQEKELMSGLAGIMEELEGFENDKQ
jgi:hypothetical protein